MATLVEFVHRPPAVPWQDGAGIPWNEPGFSRRMLKEHLSQEHDLASRREATIDAHVEWIQTQLLGHRPTSVLDLGCGPGLYTCRLAQRGHRCVGIDFSPASIAYAEEQASAGGFACTYSCEDIRVAQYGNGYGLVMLVYGELNAFHRGDARAILEKACRALAEGGICLLEVHPEEAVRTTALRGPSWYSAEHGLFSDQPHLCLREHAWDADSDAATIRHSVVDAECGEVQSFIEGRQAYADHEYQALLTSAGFADIELLPPLPGGAHSVAPDLIAIVARKGIAT